MKSSIYISSEKIQLIGYIGSAVKTFITHPLPEGTMINGMITDGAFLAECLTAMRVKNPELFKDPVLVVDGSAILVKRIAAPKLNKKQYEQLVRDDFAESGEPAADLACGYQLMGPSNTALLACAANKAIVDSYIAAFKDVGVKLSAIRIGTQAILSYVASRPELQKKTFVLNVVDGVAMLSVIFENGVNVFMSRTRLYGDDKLLLAQTLIDNLSGLIQFNRSQKFNDITDSYYLGLDENDMRLLDSLNPHSDIKLDVINIFGGVKGGENMPPDAHFVYLNTRLGGDSIDLIRCRKGLERYKKTKGSRKSWAPLMLLYILIQFAPAAYFYYGIYNMDLEIDDINAKLRDEANIARLEEISGFESMSLMYNGVIRQHNERIESENAKVHVSGRLIDLIIYGYGGVTVSQFSFSDGSGSMRIGGVSESVADTVAYVNMLKNSDLVKSVRYSGYNQGLNFSLDVTLATLGEVADG
ncbi:MAG: hypothetical protein FWH06_06895 [Oscillospiraceae bacterium]|nr:hypothetical protein [Oscillospiraceae bacterium]